MDWSLVDPLIQAALAEDVATGDVTSQATVPKQARSGGVLVAKAAGVICGLDVAGRVFLTVDAGTVFEKEVLEGEGVDAGTVVATVTGPVRSLLIAERVALNFLGHLSGVATAAAVAAKALEGSKTRVLDTRKTLPGLRLLEKYAVRCGGGCNHRMGLYDMVLIKENHIIAAGGIAAAIEGARLYAADLPLEVEVTNLVELEEALEERPDRIMLDNFDLSAMRRAVDRVADYQEKHGLRPELEVSGNVSLERLPEIASTGVDFVSMGSITHSAPALDLSFQLQNGERS